MSLGVYLILTSSQINNIQIKQVWRDVYLAKYINQTLCHYEHQLSPGQSYALIK